MKWQSCWRPPAGAPHSTCAEPCNLSVDKLLQNRRAGGLSYRADGMLPQHLQAVFGDAAGGDEILQQCAIGSGRVGIRALNAIRQTDSWPLLSQPSMAFPHRKLNSC